MKEKDKYYERQVALPEIGKSGQQKLLQSKILVIGAGGLGCPVLQYLTGAGVGYITIMDADTVNVNNLHRQVLFNVDDLGKSKSLTAAKKLQLLNPTITIQSVNEFLTVNNAFNYIKDCDLVIDGSDNFTTRYLVNDVCVATNKPFISGAVYQNYGQVSVFNYRGGPTYRCLFPDEGGENETCSLSGVTGMLCGIIGSTMAAEALKVICEIGDILSGKLWTYYLLTGKTEIFYFRRVWTNEGLEDNIKIKTDADFISSIDWKLEKNKYTIIDVRENWEFEEHNIGGINIPLPLITEKMEGINWDKVILVCANESRSKMAQKLIEQKLQKKAPYLKGGISSLGF